MAQTLTEQRVPARQHDQKGISRTFVLTDGSPVIIGFFTLRLQQSVKHFEPLI